MITDKIKTSYFWGAFSTSKPVALSKNDKSIITSLAAEFTDRSRKDIKKWRQAIQAAENPEEPNNALLQDIYTDLETDGHLQSVLTIRKRATTSVRFYIQDKNGQEVPEKTKLIYKKWFFEMIEHMLDSIFYGYTIMELVDPVMMKWKLIPRRNCLPQKEMILFEANGEKGITYTDPYYMKNVIELQNIRLLGEFNNLVPTLIWKRNARQTWADFSEKFGIPLVTAETTETDKKKLGKIEAMLTALGQAARAVLPEGTKITIHDASTKGDPHKVFHEQIKMDNEEVSKAILGGTMLNDDGSSRSQSEVHERTLDYKIAGSDRLMIEFLINDVVLPLLSSWGFQFAEGETFVFDSSEELSVKEHWEIISAALQHYNIPQEWISKRFQFPIDGEKVRQTVSTPNPQARFSENFL
jgi:phage gp29-like protein